jgi:hypothetical protein
MNATRIGGKRELELGRRNDDELGVRFVANGRFFKRPFDPPQAAVWSVKETHPRI